MVGVIYFPLKNDLSTAFLEINSDPWAGWTVQKTLIAPGSASLQAIRSPLGDEQHFQTSGTALLSASHADFLKGTGICWEEGHGPAWLGQAPKGGVWEMALNDGRAQLPGYATGLFTR